jgi:Asp-tRNA(Asn)/Glu-tRNA(Gln) amidotransferase A subunit family amidase
VSLHASTAAEIGRGLRAKKYSSVEVTKHFLGRIERANRASTRS